MGIRNGDAAVDEQHAKELGSYLRRHREAVGLTARALAAEVGTEHTKIIRIEAGRFVYPKADLLGRIAETLKIPTEDVLTMAGYPTGKKLPNLRPYMRAKYRDLPTEAVDEVEAFVAELQRKHARPGPRDGEDE